MSPSQTPPGSSLDAAATVLQVLHGGEPDEYGVDLTGSRNPFRIGYFPPECPCCRTALLVGLWEWLDGFDLYSPGSDLWLRAFAASDPEPLPAGAALLASRTVTVGLR